MSKILFIGCGKMGGALLRGVVRKFDGIIVVKPSPLAPEFQAQPSIVWVDAPEKIVPSFQPDAVVIAIKPQDMATALPAYARYASAVFLSIAAGQTLYRLTNHLNNNTQALVRAMPNLPASIGAGITVAVANIATTDPQRELCDLILRAAGDVMWVDDEALIDPVTALSGSGPAYIFALVEAMATAGEKLGLPQDLAQKLARQTLVGSGALLGQSEATAADLRRAVTSPKGTTAAALEILLGGDALLNLMSQAMAAATARAKELAESAIH